MKAEGADVPMPTATQVSGYRAASAREDAGAATRFPSWHARHLLCVYSTEVGQ